MTEPSSDLRSVVVEREFPHPPARIWRALTQPHLIAEWLMKNDFMPVVGHRFNLHGEWGGVINCEILTIKPNELLSYSWNFTHDDPAFDLRSVVTFTLSPTSAGTLLRMEQRGFQPNQRQAYGGARQGWPKFFDRLDKLLSQAD